MRNNNHILLVNDINDLQYIDFQRTDSSSSFFKLQECASKRDLTFKHIVSAVVVLIIINTVNLID